MDLMTLVPAAVSITGDDLVTIVLIVCAFAVIVLLLKWFLSKV